jgi:hypothetical protein
MAVNAPSAAEVTTPAAQLKKTMDDLRKRIHSVSKQLDATPPRKLDGKSQPLGRPLKPTELVTMQTEKEGLLKQREELVDKLADIKAEDRAQSIQRHTTECTRNVMEHTSSIGRMLHDQMHNRFDALVPLLKPKKRVAKDCPPL